MWVRLGNLCDTEVSPSLATNTILDDLAKYDLKNHIEPKLLDFE